MRGRLATASASTYKLPSFSEMPEVFNVALLERATEDGVVYGSKAVGEPPLMLAISVREALRQAAAAFGPSGTSVDLASPATPEAVFWAVRQAAAAASRPTRPRSWTGASASCRISPTPVPLLWSLVPSRSPPDREAEVHWLAAVQQLRADREPGVLVTLVGVRGHAPREAGAKMVVSTTCTWGSIGGGNLEETAVAHARSMLVRGDDVPEQLGLSLNERAPVEHGQQCCGGEVSVLLEPLAVVPSVAIFGMGHVGTELARILSRHDLELHLVDGRADRLSRSVSRFWPMRWPGCTCTTRPCPSSCSGRSPRAPTCWS